MPGKRQGRQSGENFFHGSLLRNPRNQILGSALSNIASLRRDVAARKMMIEERMYVRSPIFRENNANSALKKAVDHDAVVAGQSSEFHSSTLTSKLGKSLARELHLKHGVRRPCPILDIGRNSGCRPLEAGPHRIKATPAAAGSQSKMTESLSEKQILLDQRKFLIGEVNHRVQNSLQLVSAFCPCKQKTLPTQILSRQSKRRGVGSPQFRFFTEAFTKLTKWALQTQGATSKICSKIWSAQWERHGSKKFLCGLVPLYSPLIE